MQSQITGNATQTWRLRLLHGGSSHTFDLSELSRKPIQWSVASPPSDYQNIMGKTFWELYEEGRAISYQYVFGLAASHAYSHWEEPSLTVVFSGFGNSKRYTYNAHKLQNVESGSATYDINETVADLPAPLEAITITAGDGGRDRSLTNIVASVTLEVTVGAPPASVDMRIEDVNPALYPAGLAPPKPENNRSVFGELFGLKATQVPGETPPSHPLIVGVGLEEQRQAQGASGLVPPVFEGQVLPPGHYVTPEITPPRQPAASSLPRQAATSFPAYVSRETAVLPPTRRPLVTPIPTPTEGNSGGATPDIALSGFGAQDHSAYLIGVIKNLTAVFEAQGAISSKLRAVYDLLSRFDRYSLRIGPTLVIPKSRAFSVTRYYAFRDGNFLLQINAQGDNAGWRPPLVSVARMVATSRDSITPEDHAARYVGPDVVASFEDEQLDLGQL